MTSNTADRGKQNKKQNKSKQNKAKNNTQPKLFTSDIKHSKQTGTAKTYYNTIFVI